MRGKKHTDESIKIYKCTQFEYKTKYSGKLPKHITTNHDRKKHACVICEWEDLSYKGLQNHMKSKHAENTLKAELKLKIGKTIDNEKRRKYPVCLITLQNSLLRRHLDRHSQIKVHECDQCGEKFVTIYELKNHNLLHKGLRPYEWKQPVCKKALSGS